MKYWTVLPDSDIFFRKTQQDYFNHGVNNSAGAAAEAGQKFRIRSTPHFKSVIKNHPVARFQPANFLSRRP